MLPPDGGSSHLLPQRLELKVTGLKPMKLMCYIVWRWRCGQEESAKRRKVNHACLYCRSNHMTYDKRRPCRRWWVLLLVWIESSCLFTAHFIVWLPSFIYLFWFRWIQLFVYSSVPSWHIKPNLENICRGLNLLWGYAREVKLANGFQIGSHTWSHLHLPSLTQEQSE